MIKCMPPDQLSDYRAAANAIYHARHRARVLALRKEWNTANAAYKVDNKRMRRANQRIA